MKPHYKKVFLVSVVLFTILLITYINFSSFRPKVISQIREVRGVKTDSFADLPYPDGFKELGIDKTSNGRQITMKVESSSLEIQNFYKNILISKGWTLESAGTAGIFLNSEYKKGDQIIQIKTSNENGSDFTLLSIYFFLPTK